MKYSLVWELDSLFPHPNDAKFRQTVNEYETQLKQLADDSESLPAPDGEAETVAAWESFLDAYELVATRTSDLVSFIECHAAADAENKLFQQFEAHLSSLQPLLHRAATNMDFSLRDATDEELDAMFDASERLRTVRFFVCERQQAAELRLPKEQETLSAELAVDGIDAWGRLYDRISGELRVSVMERGEIVQKSVGQVQWDSPHRPSRINNFHAASKAWQSIADTCADAINHIAGTRLTTYRRTGLEDHLVVPLHLNRLQRATLLAMWDAIDRRKETLVKYLQAKAKAFGIEKLAWYDLNAPFPVNQKTDNKISYDEACDTVIDTFHEFSPELGEFAQRAVNEQWIEVDNRPGKRQGGFCTDFPTAQQSRIFMTFTDSPDSMSTLAHELGHAYHSFVLRDQPGLLRGYPMNLAETASTFAEAILGDRRLAASESDADRISILDGMLSDAVAFLMNIQARFMFEDAFHKERQEGELSAERLSELMVSAQKTAYADQLSEWDPLFWASKLHFYISGWPFYNFPYTFGYLLSLGTYAIGKEGGSDFAEQYRQLLIATGSMTTEDAVRSTLGYDLTTPDFWEKSLTIVDERVDSLLSLVE
ncbi:MAG: M3 family oligoendopeptidase [Planctomycetales bacterium]|nr:M3 family oligoendopeptidase [Planctomycetales bacterium]